VPAAQKNESLPAAKPVPEGMTPKAILKSRDFWLLSMAILFGALAGQALIVHQIPYLVSVGFSRQTAGIFTVIVALSNVADAFSLVF